MDAIEKIQKDIKDIDEFDQYKTWNAYWFKLWIITLRILLEFLKKYHKTSSGLRGRRY